MLLRFLCWVVSTVLQMFRVNLIHTQAKKKKPTKIFAFPVRSCIHAKAISKPLIFGFWQRKPSATKPRLFTVTRNTISLSLRCHCICKIPLESIFSDLVQLWCSGGEHFAQKILANSKQSHKTLFSTFILLSAIISSTAI